MVDKNNREDLKKTPIYKLVKLDDDHVIFIDEFSKNFEKIESILGNINSIEASEIEDKTIENFIKYLMKKIDTMALDDEHIQVIANSKKLNLVLKDLENKDSEIIGTIREYKTSVDEYSENLGIYVNRHSTANTKLEALL